MRLKNLFGFFWKRGEDIDFANTLWGLLTSKTLWEGSGIIAIMSGALGFIQDAPLWATFLIALCGLGVGMAVILLGLMLWDALKGPGRRAPVVTIRQSGSFGSSLPITTLLSTGSGPLDVFFAETDQRCRDETKFNGALDVVFFRLVITNRGATNQHQCRGYVTKVERRDGASTTAYQGIADLTWMGFSSPLPTKIDLSPNEERILDVFFIAANKQIGFATQGFVQPGNIGNFFGPDGLYTFDVTIVSSDSNARTTRLTLDWRGDWKTAAVKPTI